MRTEGRRKPAVEIGLVIACVALCLFAVQRGEFEAAAFALIAAIAAAYAWRP